MCRYPSLRAALRGPASRPRRVQLDPRAHDLGVIVDPAERMLLEETLAQSSVHPSVSCRITKALQELRLGID